MAAPRGWTSSFFRRDIFSPSQPEALAHAAAEARFVFRALGLSRGDRLLDVACGTGRHDFPLARRGVLVTGVDVTREYLAEARRRARGAANPVFRRGDMRRLPFRGQFDAAMNLWTSFGYFASPAEDLRALVSIRRALRPGGRFLIDVLNPAWLRGSFQERQWRPLAGGGVVLEEARLAAGRDPRVESEWTVVRPGRPWVSSPMSVRLYDRRRLSAALRRAGLRVLRSWGGLDGSRLTDESPRLVLLAAGVRP